MKTRRINLIRTVALSGGHLNTSASFAGTWANRCTCRSWSTKCYGCPSMWSDLCSPFVSRASPSGWSDGSCLPERAWRGRRLSISAASTRTKRSSELPVRSWRASFWQPNRLVINSAATNPLQFVYFHVFVLNWLQNREKKLAACLKGILMLLWSGELEFSLLLAVKSASCAVFHLLLDFIGWLLCVWWLLIALLF